MPPATRIEGQDTRTLTNEIADRARDGAVSPAEYGWCRATPGAQRAPTASAGAVVITHIPDGSEAAAFLKQFQGRQVKINLLRKDGIPFDACHVHTRERYRVKRVSADSLTVEKIDEQGRPLFGRPALWLTLPYSEIFSVHVI